MYKVAQYNIGKYSIVPIVKALDSQPNSEIVGTQY